MSGESTLSIDALGTKLWKNRDGKFHRLDGPAIEYTGGTKEWWQNGKLHRLDGPAIEYGNGAEEWWREGSLHRLDGPAYILPNGHMEWYRKKQLHRKDGPAIIYADGSKSWYLNGVCYETKEKYFDALTDEAKAKCLFSEDFLSV
jgi:hypothetical protein